MKLTGCHCPSCLVRFTPWRAWRLGIWNSIPCPQCGIALRRKLGVVYVIAVFLWTLAGCIPLLFLFFLSFPFWQATLIFVAFMAALWIVDVLTVRLAVAKSVLRASQTSIRGDA